MAVSHVANSGVYLATTGDGSTTGFATNTDGPNADGTTTAGTNRFYTVASFVKGGGVPSVSSVSGGSLSWTLVKQQCAGRDQVQCEVWGAYGSPGADFAVTVNFASAPGNSKGLVLIADAWDGVDGTTQTEDPVGHNTVGENGACSGGSDGNAPELTTGSTVADSAHYVAVNSRAEALTGIDDYSTEIRDITGGSGGNRSTGSTLWKIKTATGDDQFLGAFGGNQDWATAGMVIKASAGAPSTAVQDVIGRGIIPFSR